MPDMRIVMHAGLTAILAWFALYFELYGGLIATDPNLRYMEAIATQRLWAVFFLAAANLGIIGLSTSRPVFRLVSVLAVSTAHGLFAGCLILGGAGIWSGTYAIIAAMGYVLAFRWTSAGL